MKKITMITMALALLAVSAFGECLTPLNEMIIDKSAELCGDTYDLLGGISITANNVELDCKGAVLRGIVGQSEIGIKVENAENVTIRNCNILTYNQGIYLKNATHSLIEENAILKNRIGVRMLDSFENVIRENSDKSFQVAVSAINSKFNTVMLGNKNIERGFCDENACNEEREMNVCENGDFYCSASCTFALDDDCSKPKTEKIDEKPEGQTIEEKIAEFEKEIKQEKEIEKEKLEQKTEEKNNLSIITKIIIYLVLYGLAFVGLYVLKKEQ